MSMESIRWSLIRTADSMASFEMESDQNVVKLKNRQNFSMTSNSRENMKGGILVNIKVGRQ